MAVAEEEEHDAFLSLELSQHRQQDPSPSALTVNPGSQWTKKKGLVVAAAAMLVLLSAVLLFLIFSGSSDEARSDTSSATTSIRNESLSPEFHFQPPPPHLWMTASNAPVFYRGFYHLFYGSASSGTFSWGHAVSDDLVHWSHLPAALDPGEWYDEHGVLGGSVTNLPGSNNEHRPVIFYTGISKDGVATQNAAVPVDPQDPMLKKWKKVDRNPLIAMPPPGIDSAALRDPSSGWKDREWRVVLGSRNGSDGVGFVYSSSEFLEGDWKKLETPFLRMPGVGLLESLDFFPISSDKHVLKASLRDSSTTSGSESYTLGTYFPGNGSFVPDVNISATGSLGSRYDHGDKFFAGKTFVDTGNNVRVLVALIPEEKSITSSAPLQSIPRKLWLGRGDDLDGEDVLLQLPVDEVEKLRISPGIHKAEISLEPRTVTEVGGGSLSQLDLELVFELPDLSMQMSLENFDVELSSSGNAAAHCRKKGAGVNGLLGPFGVLVLATGDRAEQTAIFYHLGRSRKGPVALVCADLTRSSLQDRRNSQQDAAALLHGAFVHLADPSVLRDREAKEELLELRLLVDKSVLEVFAQGGKATITSRVFPTMARGDSARVFLFNNGTTSVRVKRLDVWRMKTTK